MATSLKTLVVQTLLALSSPCYDSSVRRRTYQAGLMTTHNAVFLLCSRGQRHQYGIESAPTERRDPLLACGLRPSGRRRPSYSTASVFELRIGCLHVGDAQC